MASVAAAAAASRCRSLLYCTHRLQGSPLSALRQNVESIEKNHLSHQQSTRSFHSLHERGRRTKSTTTTKGAPKTSDQQTYDSDLVVVLDLDECLVHSKFLTRQGQAYAHQVPQQALSSSEANSDSHMVDTFHIALPCGDLARVHQRPHLQDFLQEVSSKYETHLFTAGKEVYAQSVLQHLDPNGSIFTNCLYRDDCTYDPMMKAYVKNLDMHFDDMQRTVLVDNNHLSFLNNPNNGILVSNFFDDPSDTTLLAVSEFLGELEQEEDVRPLLQAHFGLSEFLERRQHHEMAKHRQKKQQDEILESTEQLMINVSV